MDLQKTQQVVLDICKQAGENLHEYFESGKFSTRSKGGVDFATQADDEIDEFLRTELKKAFPQTEFLTEETAGNDFSGYRDKENLWIIDPIDGTTNFSRRNPHFAISVGLVNRGQPILGVVYLPIVDTYYSAHVDGKALRNGREIHVSNTSDLKISTVSFDWAWDMDERRKTYEVIKQVVLGVRQSLTFGAASIEICMVAEGKIDGYFQYGLKPWDHAAASLILRKAGGKITRVDGSEWNVFDLEIFATNRVIHDELLTLLK